MKVRRFIYKLLPRSWRVWGNSVAAKHNYNRKAGTPFGLMGDNSGAMMRGDGHLTARVFRKESGKVEEYDLGHNTITNTGVNTAASSWVNNTALQWNNHQMGVGGSPPGTPAVTATALVTPVESVTAGTVTGPSANVFQTVATIVASAPRSVNEWGLFKEVGATTLFANKWFTAIGLSTGDSIQFTYQFTFTSFTS